MKILILALLLGVADVGAQESQFVPQPTLSELCSKEKLFAERPIKMEMGALRVDVFVVFACTYRDLFGYDLKSQGINKALSSTDNCHCADHVSGLVVSRFISNVERAYKISLEEARRNKWILGNMTVNEIIDEITKAVVASRR